MISSLGYCACRSEYLHPESRIPNPLETAMGLDLAVFTLGHVQYREHFVPGLLSVARLAMVVGLRGALLSEILKFWFLRTCVRPPSHPHPLSICPPRPSVYPKLPIERFAAPNLAIPPKFQETEAHSIASHVIPVMLHIIKEGDDVTGTFSHS